MMKYLKYFQQKYLIDCEAETEVLLSRPRRRTEKYSDANVDDLLETIKKLEQRISDLEDKKK